MLVFVSSHTTTIKTDQNTKLNSNFTENISSVVTYIHIKTAGLAWALSNSEEVSLGCCASVVAFTCSYSRRLYWHLWGLSGSEPHFSVLYFFYDTLFLRDRIQHV